MIVVDACCCGGVSSALPETAVTPRREAPVHVRHKAGPLWLFFPHAANVPCFLSSDGVMTGNINAMMEALTRARPWQSYSSLDE